MTLMRRLAPVISIAAVAALVLAMGWHRYLTLEVIAQNRKLLQDAVSAYYLPSLAAYICLYAIAVALSLPGGLVLTLTGGLLFGWLTGGAAAVIGATIGATLVFQVARSALGNHLAARAGPWLAALREGFRSNALSYLLFLRLVPAFPFWLVNLAPALLGVPLSTYVLGTLIGIVPGTLAFASVGAGLDSVIGAAQAQHVACLLHKGANDCPFKLDARALLEKDLLIAFALLGLVALIPIALKRVGARSEARS